MYWDLLKVDLFRRQIRSNKRLVSFAVSLTHPGMYLALVFLVCGGAYLSITNVPTKHQLPTPYGFRDIAWTRFNMSRSLQQGQRSNQCHTMMLHTYNP